MEIIFVRHGESIANVSDDNSYDPQNIYLTSDGIKQCKKTGKYLKVFGNLDIVIISPMLRCAETTEIILNELDYNGNILIDERLIERGNNYDILKGLSKREKNKLIPKELRDLESQITDEPNPFKRTKLGKKFRKMREKLLPYSPTSDEANDNYIDFLNWLSKQNYSRVLIISHSCTMGYIMRIICGLNNYNTWIQIGSANQLKWLNNCSVMCVLYDKSINKFELVSAPEDNHLE
jgi:broad specificity phosphatase PhoE